MANNSPGSTQPQLTWDAFFALRRTRRRIGQACSGIGAVGVTYFGLTTMINNGYDATLSAQLGGFDPFMLMGLSTLGMMGVGWLIGPIFGNQVFNLAYRGVITEFTRVCLQQSQQHKNNRDITNTRFTERLGLFQPHQTPPCRSYRIVAGQSSPGLLWREDWQCGWI